MNHNASLSAPSLHARRIGLISAPILGVAIASLMPARVARTPARRGLAYGLALRR
jgi:hypothetical protein